MSYDQFKSITVQQMETLVALVEAGSFTGGSDAVLFTAQPYETDQKS